VKFKSSALTCHLRSYLELTVSYGWLADSSTFVLLGEGFVVIQVEFFVCLGASLSSKYNFSQTMENESYYLYKRPG
jgi:hypothetical protein